MKRLLIQVPPPTDVNVADDTTADKATDNKYSFSATDIVDILNQIDEVKDNSAIKIEDGVLILGIGDSRYEISEVREKRYPRRRLRKLDT